MLGLRRLRGLVPRELRGLPARLLVIVRPGGERHYMEKEPLEGLEAWADGLPATIAEYRFVKIVHTPPPKPKEP